MTFDSQAELAKDPAFLARLQACATAKALESLTEGPPVGSLATSLLRGEAGELATLARVVAAKVVVAEPLYGLPAVTDEALTEAVEEAFGIVAALYFPTPPSALPVPLYTADPLRAGTPMTFIEPYAPDEIPGPDPDFPRPMPEPEPAGPVDRLVPPDGGT